MSIPTHSPYGFPQVSRDSAGNEIRNGGEQMYLRLYVDFTLADAAVLYTVPANTSIAIRSCMWEVTAAWTGGTSSAIGISSDLAPHDTKGDIHGGASGDVLATLTAGFKRGTQGASFTAAPNCVVLTAGKLIRFDRIASVFTAGAGYIHLDAIVVG
jgi:hypothetical protein